MAVKKKQVSSCYECAGIVSCYGTHKPDIPRAEARERAARCGSLRRGRTVEVVSVLGRQRGMSRKKAQALVQQGRAIWLWPKLLCLLPFELPSSTRQPKIPP